MRLTKLQIFGVVGVLEFGPNLIYFVILDDRAPQRARASSLLSLLSVFLVSHQAAMPPKSPKVASTVYPKFSFALGYEPRAPNKMSETLGQAEDQWFKQGSALVKGRNGWWQVHKVYQNQASFSVRLSKESNGKGNSVTKTERKLLVGEGDGTCPETIIFGAIGDRMCETGRLQSQYCERTFECEH